MTIADLRPFVIVEKQHVHFFDFGLWLKFLIKKYEGLVYRG